MSAEESQERVGGVSPLSTPACEAVLKDGFKWIKYGRKKVTGIYRHYYRCNVDGCEAKKHVHMVDPENPTETLIGSHNHQPSRITMASITTELQIATMLQQFSWEGSDQSSTLTLELPSLELNPQKDGCQWHGYGLKRLKKCTREYLRCAVPGCPLRKTVDQRAQGYTVTYRGGPHQHDGTVNKTHQQHQQQQQQQKERHVQRQVGANSKGFRGEKTTKKKTKKRTDTSSSKKRKRAKAVASTNSGEKKRGKLDESLLVAKARRNNAACGLDMLLQALHGELY